MFFKYILKKPSIFDLEYGSSSNWNSSSSVGAEILHLLFL